MAQPSSVFQNHRVVAGFATRSQAVTCGRYQSTLQSRHALAQSLTIEQLKSPDPPPFEVWVGAVSSCVVDSRHRVRGFDSGGLVHHRPLEPRSASRCRSLRDTTAEV